jgi:hypothetical protein
LADGAKDNWLYLDAVTRRQVVDFFHVAQYVWKAAEALFADAGAELRPWVDPWCHRLTESSTDNGTAATAVVGCRRAG